MPKVVCNQLYILADQESKPKSGWRGNAKPARSCDHISVLCGHVGDIIRQGGEIIM